MTLPHHYIHHTFFTSDSTHYTTYGTPFNLWPTPILPYLIYIWLQFTTNHALFTSDPTHYPICATPLRSLTPPLYYLQYTTYFPLWSHTVTTYTTPISILTPPTTLLMPHLLHLWPCPNIIYTTASFDMTYHTTPSSHLFAGIVNLLKMLLCFFINLFFTMLLKVNYEVNRRIVRRKERSFFNLFWLFLLKVDKTWRDTQFAWNNISDRSWMETKSNSLTVT